MGFRYERGAPEKETALIPEGTRYYRGMTETVSFKLKRALLIRLDGLTNNRSDFIRAAVEEKIRRANRKGQSAWTALQATAALNIRVNCVAPGAIETEGWNVYTQEARAAYPRSNPMMRVGSPWDIAEACVYLAGPSGKFVTGETLTVDGGGQLWGETWTTGKPRYFGGEEG